MWEGSSKRWFAIPLAVAMCVAGTAGPAGAAAATDPLVLVCEGGGAVSLSADGGLLAFSCGAANLVPDDTNGQGDVFVRDQATGGFERISLGTGGVQANGLGWRPSITPDGRFVAFLSRASNLAAADPDRLEDVYVRDRRTGTTVLASVRLPGRAGADEFLGQPQLTPDGRFVAFHATADNLVPGDTNRESDVFVRDLMTGTTERVSVGARGAQGDAGSFAPAISADGRYVAFASYAGNLVAGDSARSADVFVRDRLTGTTVRASVDSDGRPGVANFAFINPVPSISADGRFVAFASGVDRLVPDDTNGRADVFVRDLVAGKTERVNVNSAGVVADGVSSGRFVQLTADGRHVIFWSTARNLVAGDRFADEETFVRDRLTGTTTKLRVVLDSQGSNVHTVGDGLAVSADLSTVAFSSIPNILIPDNQFCVPQVFVWRG